MKAKLTFDLDNDEDQTSFKQCVKANAMAGVLWEINYNLKKGIEYECEQDKGIDPVELTFVKIYQLLDEYGIDIDDLYT
jgi:hypothetical protein